MPVGERIRDERLRMGMTQVELAKAVGFSSGNVSRWESEKIVPTIRTVRILAEFFGIPVADLMGFKEKGPAAWKKDADNLLKTLSDISPEFVWDLERAFGGKVLSDQEGKELIFALRNVIQVVLHAKEQ